MDRIKRITKAIIKRRPARISVRIKTYTITIILALLLMHVTGSPTQPNPTDKYQSATVAASLAAAAVTTGTLIRESIDLPAERYEKIHHMNLHRGDAPQSSPTPDQFNISTINIGGSIKKQWSTIIDETKTGIQDAIILTETGDHNSKAELQWLTREYISKKEHSSQQFFNKLPYMIFNINSKDISGNRGGTVILLHNRWAHRVRNKPTYDPHNRWISIDISTPNEKLTLIACYMRPSPQANKTQSKIEWTSLTNHILRKHTKGFTIILAGDTNTTLNLPGHSTRPKGNTYQHKLLETLMNDTNMTHTYIHRHGDQADYRTRINKPDGTYSSPDHILISTQEADRIKKAGVDEQPIREQTRDHARVHTSIQTCQPFHTPITKQSEKIIFDTKKKDKYAKEVQLELDNIPTPTDDIEKGRILFEQCKATAKNIFTRKAHQTPKNTQVAILKNDRRKLNTMLHHQKTQTPAPPQITKCRVIKELPDQQIKTIQKAIQDINRTLNSKGRKRRKRQQQVWKDKRSGNFAKKEYSKFFKSALGKHSNYKGVVGIYDPQTDSIDTTAETVKRVATARISQKFYRGTTQTPAYIRTPSQEEWNKLPPIIRDTFHPTHLPERAPDPKFKDVMKNTWLEELLGSLKKMGRKKAGGPSGLTVEMLLHLPEDIQREWLLPFINKCLQDKDIPPFLKKFYVWPTEKKPGEGSIMHPTEKIQLRPITLFEVVSKLTEHIINKRLMHILVSTKHLNRHQYAFRPETEAK